MVLDFPLLGPAFAGTTLRRAFPPRLPEQPIFYPVLSEAYTAKIARDWNVPADGAGFVTRFPVRREFLDRHASQEAGGKAHLEYWIPAEDLAEPNAGIVGLIEAPVLSRLEITRTPTG